MYLKLFATGYAFTYYSVIIDCDRQKSEQLYFKQLF